MPAFTLEHIGIAVSDAFAAAALFEQLLGSRPYKVETVEREGVRTHFLGDGGKPNAAPKLELLEAIDEASPVVAFLEKRGPGIHHLAFEVDDIDAEMTRLGALGFRWLSDAAKPGADGKRIAFLNPKSTGGVLVELCQSMPPVRRAVPFEGDQLAVFVSGPEEAPPLVVLHAALGSTEMETRRLTRIWEKSFRVYALDFMAHGASDAFDDQPLSMERFADNVIAMMDAEEIERAHLFGFSLGGSVSLMAALRHPQRFDRLAIHAHNVQWTFRERDLMIGAMRSALDAPESRWSSRLAYIHGEDRWCGLVTRMIAFTADLPNQPLQAQNLACIGHPTLVSSGDRDHFFGIRHAMMLHETLPNASLAILPGVEHAIQTVDVVSFVGQVRAHLTSA